MSLKLEDVMMVASDVGLDKDKYNLLVKKLEELEEENKSLGAAKEKSKSKYVVMVRGDKELADKVSQAWVVYVPENSDNTTLISRMQSAMGAHNAASRKKKLYITKWSDLMEFLKRKFSKANDFQVKTKEPVDVIVLENENVGEIPVV